MKKEEAITILEDKLNQYRKLGYSELVKKVGKQETFEGKSEDNESYQIEVDFFFDDEEGKTVRVLAMLFYSLWTDFSPVNIDFIMTPNGKFIDE